MKKTTTFALSAVTALALACVPVAANAAPTTNPTGSLNSTVNTTTGSLTNTVSSLTQPSAAPSTPSLTNTLNNVANSTSYTVATTVPSQMLAPTGVLNSDSTVTSTWSVPTDFVTALIGSYQLQEIINGTVVRTATLPSTATAYVSSVLDHGMTYATRIIPVNSLGSGAASSLSNLATIAIDPSVTTNVGSGTSTTTTPSAPSTPTTPTSTPTASSTPTAPTPNVLNGTTPLITGPTVNTNVGSETGTSAPSTPSTPTTPTTLPLNVPSDAPPANEAPVSTTTINNTDNSVQNQSTTTNAPASPPSTSIVVAPASPLPSMAPQPVTSTQEPVAAMPVPGVPSAPKITKIKAAGTMLSIKWKKSTASHSKVKQYIVKVYKGAKLIKTITAPASHLSVKITKLKAHTKYILKIAAISKHGKVSKWTTKTVRTK